MDAENFVSSLSSAEVRTLYRMLGDRIQEEEYYLVKNSPLTDQEKATLVSGEKVQTIVAVRRRLGCSVATAVEIVNFHLGNM